MSPLKMTTWEAHSITDCEFNREKGASVAFNNIYLVEHMPE